MSDERTSGPSRLGRLITHRDGSLSTLEAQARWLRKVENTLSACLPDSYEGHWQVAALGQNALVVSVPSSVWVTGLRARQTALLDAAEALLGARPGELRVRVLPPPPPPPEPPPGPTLSEQAAQSLRNAASGMEDPRLAEALSRLAGRKRNR